MRVEVFSYSWCSLFAIRLSLYSHNTHFLVNSFIIWNLICNPVAPNVWLTVTFLSLLVYLLEQQSISHLALLPCLLLSHAPSKLALLLKSFIIVWCFHLIGTWVGLHELPLTTSMVCPNNSFYFYLLLHVHSQWLWDSWLWECAHCACNFNFDWRECLCSRRHLTVLKLLSIIIFVPVSSLAANYLKNIELWECHDDICNGNIGSGSNQFTCTFILNVQKYSALRVVKIILIYYFTLKLIYSVLNTIFVTHNLM